jgi:hypothetical protein
MFIEKRYLSNQVLIMYIIKIVDANKCLLIYVSFDIFTDENVVF